LKSCETFHQSILTGDFKKEREISTSPQGVINSEQVARSYNFQGFDLGIVPDILVPDKT
jgi:hypothetical protein